MESTQKNHAYGLTNYGPVDEVFEIAQELVFNDEKFAIRFINKALDAGVHFTPEQTLELPLIVDKATLGRMAEKAHPSFTRDQLEEIYMLIEDEVFTRISKKLGIDIFEDEDAEAEKPDEDYEDYPEERPVKIGFLYKAHGSYRCSRRN